MKRILVVVFAFLLILLYLSVNVSYSLEGKLTEFTIKSNRVEANIKAKDCFDYDLEEIILNGIPVKFLFDIKLYRQSRYWFDRELSSSKINHSIEYDNLKDVFTIHYNNKVTPSVEVDNLSEAESLVSSVKDFKITPQEVLSPGKDYYITYEVEIEADTKNSRLPLYLDYIFNLFPWPGNESDNETAVPANQ